MRTSLVPILRCPACGRDGDWALDVERSDDREIREGRLTCRGCGRERGVSDGVVDLLERPPDYVTREAAGLERFADLMRADGWDRDRVLQLPWVGLDYWYEQSYAMREALAVLGDQLPERARILDVGSNTCWASAIFAERGLEVVALDISVHEMQGLRTADWWFEDKGVFFERVLSTMFAPAFASESFDAVWCCEVLHHNHRANLEATLRELYRLLRPGGWLLVANEPMRYPLNRKRDHASEVAQFEGHEHVHYFHQYFLAARRAGFVVRLPQLHAMARPGPINGAQPAAATGWGRTRTSLRDNPHAQRALPAYRLGRFAWRNVIAGDVPLRLYGRKPQIATRRAGVAPLR